MNIFMRLLKLFILLSVLILLISSRALAASFNIDSLNLQEAAPQSNRPVAYFKIGLKEAWQKINGTLGLNLSPITIGIIDTGIDNSHPEFAGVKKGNTPPDALIDRGILINSELESHGTNVAGIIGANNISSYSPVNYVFPQMNGVVSGVKNLDYQLEIRSHGRSIVDEFSALYRVFQLSQSGTKIINLSFGNFIFAPQIAAITPFYDLIFRTYQDILFVIAAGNNNSNVAFITPANLGGVSNVITVGGTTLSDQRESDSNFGSQVGISAPAEFVFSPTFFSEPLDIFDYEDFSGTSASAPMVTGVAGLIKAIKPGLSPAEIKDILIRNADPIQTDKPIGGRLNALKAVCDPLVGLNCVPTPPPVIPAPWPMLQKNAQRTGLADVSGPAFATSTQVTIKWQKTIPSAFFSFPLIGGDGAVYVPAVSSVFAFDGQTGEQKWQSANLGSLGGGALSPDSKTIYICGLDGLTSILTALNTSDGSIKWKSNVGNFRICNNPAVGSDGTIYTSLPPAFNLQLNIAVAVNPDGTEKWRHEEGGTATTPPALSKDESQDYVSFRNRLTTFNSQTGQILWTQFGINFDTFILVDNEERVIVLDPVSGISAFSKSGSLLWRQPLGSLFSANLLPNGDIAAFSDSRFFRFNPSTGDIVSSLPLPSPLPTGFVSVPPIVDKDMLLYVPFRNAPEKPHGLIVVDTLGNLRWLFGTMSIPSGVAFGSDETIYFTTRDTVYALGR